MRETVAAFRARTGLAYRPFDGLAVAAGEARALADDEPCPTLFRYPGPFALAEALARGLPPLAPPSAGRLWLCDDPLAAAPAAVRHFGSLVLLQPLRLAPAVVDDPIAGGAARAFLAAPRPVDEALVSWLPPSRALAGGAAWDGVATAAEARELLGPEADEERAEVLERLSAYLEELGALASAGAPAPGRAWCELDPGERARLLAAHGVSGRWRG